MTPEKSAEKIMRDNWAEESSPLFQRSILHISDAIRNAILIEREACAKLIEAAAIPGDQHDLCLILGDAVRNRK